MLACCFKAFCCLRFRFDFHIYWQSPLLSLPVLSPPLLSLLLHSPLLPSLPVPSPLPPLLYSPLLPSPKLPSLPSCPLSFLLLSFPLLCSPPSPPFLSPLLFFLLLSPPFLLPSEGWTPSLSRCAGQALHHWTPYRLSVGLWVALLQWMKNPPNNVLSVCEHICVILYSLSIHS